MWQQSSFDAQPMFGNQKNYTILLYYLYSSGWKGDTVINLLIPNYADLSEVFLRVWRSPDLKSLMSSVLIDSDMLKETKNFGLLKHWHYLEVSIATEGNTFWEKTFDSALPQTAKLRAGSFQMKYFCDMYSVTDMLPTSSSLNEVQIRLRFCQTWRNKWSFRLSLSNASLDLSRPVLNAATSSCESNGLISGLRGCFPASSIHIQSVAGHLTELL